MAGFLTVLLIAALVGIFKPYVKGAKRWQFGIAAFACLVLIGVFSDQPKTQSTEKKTATTENQAKKEATASNSSEPTVTKEPESEWTYSTDTDEMRGTETHYAELKATNVIHLDFPYGDQTGKILVRQSPKFGFDILVGVASGQILCNSFQDTYISVKFDDGPIQRFGCTDASDGTNNMVFVQGAKNFLAKLKKSKKAIVEAEFYQNGVQQMSFDTENLKWGN